MIHFFDHKLHQVASDGPDSRDVGAASEPSQFRHFIALQRHSAQYDTRTKSIWRNRASQFSTSI